MTLLTRERIEAAFERLADELAQRGVTAEVYVVGGAVMCLAFDARPSTKDVDAWFAPADAVRDAARDVARDLGLPEDWLNDAAKAFLPENAAFERWRSWPSLAVSVAQERTLLAMKCAAARTAEDVGDIKFLAARLGLGSAAEVLSVVMEFFPAERLPIRTRLLLEEIYDDRA
jgi:cytosine/adenosine deaminase-related metal-dependent hydrolase